MKSRKYILISILEIFAIFVLPIILLLGNWLPLGQRYLLAIPVSMFILQALFREKWSLKKLGIRMDNFKGSIIPYSVFTLVGLMIIVILAKIFDRQITETLFTHPHFKYAFLITSFFQEFAYRGYLVPKLETLTNSVPLQVTVNALLFSALHYFFPQPEFVLPATFILGVALTLIYKCYPNLLLVSLVHSIFNFVAVMFCFASMNTSCSN